MFRPDSSALEECGRPLLVAWQLYRALAHKIRTPLSVISNELYCLPGSPVSLERSRRRCREIAGILSDIPAEFLSSISFEAIPLADLDIDVRADPGLTVMADAKLLATALGMFKSLCIEVFNTSSDLKEIPGDGYDRTTHIGLSATIDHAGPSPSPGRYSSLTSYLAQHIGSDSVLPMFIDSIFWAHKIESDIIAGQKSVFYFSIPVCR